MLALLVAMVMVTFVSGFFKQTKEGQDKTFEPGISSVDLAYKKVACQSECVELCFQGVEDPHCSVFDFTDPNSVCTCSREEKT